MMQLRPQRLLADAGRELLEHALHADIRHGERSAHASNFLFALDRAGKLEKTLALDELEALPAQSIDTPQIRPVDREPMGPLSHPMLDDVANLRGPAVAHRLRVLRRIEKRVY